MKKLVIAAVLVTGCLGISIKADKLLHAIDAVDVNEVEQLLSEHKELEHNYKTTLEKAAYDSAKHAKHKTKRIWRSGYDVLRLLAGSGFIAAGCVIAVAGIAGGYMLNNFEHKLLAAGGGLTGAAISSIFGLNQMYKGWTVYSARERLKKAREIEAIIVQKPAHHQHHEHHGHHE